jgi:Uma2 family endonuclease
MLQPATLPSPTHLVYPDSDGQPLAENTKQLRWIVVLFDNLAALYHNREDIFVAADLLWYPVEGQPEVRIAPDTLVVFGRPKGHRGSYMQWQENNIPLTVVFEILSPSNTFTETDDKLAFYEEHGVEECYIYNPENNRLQVFVRQGEVLRRVRGIKDYISPRLGIRFLLTETEMQVFGPDGRRFLTFEELEAARKQAEQQASEAKDRASQAEQRASQAEQRASQAEQRTSQAEQRASQAEQRTSQSQQRAARLAELSRKARRGLATPEEIQELDRLEEASGPPAS